MILSGEFCSGSNATWSATSARAASHLIVETRLQREVTLGSARYFSAMHKSMQLNMYTCMQQALPSLEKKYYICAKHVTKEGETAAMWRAPKCISINIDICICSTITIVFLLSLFLYLCKKCDKGGETAAMWRARSSTGQSVTAQELDYFHSDK